MACCCCCCWTLVGQPLMSPLGSWAGLLRASLGLHGPSPQTPPWALMGRPLRGVPGPLWAGPLWAPFALMGLALMGPCGPLSAAPSWDPLRIPWRFPGNIGDHLGTAKLHGFLICSLFMKYERISLNVHVLKNFL